MISLRGWACQGYKEKSWHLIHLGIALLSLLVSAPLIVCSYHLKGLASRQGFITATHVSQFRQRQFACMWQSEALPNLPLFCMYTWTFWRIDNVALLSGMTHLNQPVFGWSTVVALGLPASRIGTKIYLIDRLSALVRINWGIINLLIRSISAALQKLISLARTPCPRSQS